jgi:predicted nucleotidyltransferase
MSKNDVLKILLQVKTECADKYGIIDLGLFGSVARDEARSDSDVDVCVRTRTPDPFILVHLKEELERRTHQRVDIVRMRDNMNKFLRLRIEKECVYV